MCGAAMISIIIPTLNEAKTLPLALESIKAQNLPDVEVLVVDSASRDGTREISSKFGAKLLDYPGKPLGARKHGLMNSAGEFVLLMDADQVLQPGALSRALAAIKDRDMIVLEERSYRIENWVQRSLDNQKRFMHQRAMKANGIGLHIYPRFFRRAILEKAYALIPEELLPSIFVFDDSLLYSKLRSISSGVGMIPDAMLHIEEKDSFHLIRHNLRLGRSAKVMKTLVTRSSFHQTKSSFEMFLDAAKNRYLLMSLLKELSFQFGYRFG
jgi:glycosyltransferase involved in cell wall biosynthesis